MSWHSRAYGLALSGDPLPGLAAVDAAPGGPSVEVRSASAADIDAAWPAAQARRISEERPEPGAPPRTIDEHPEAGWRLDAPGWGLAVVARDGARLDCAQGDSEEWRWQRFVVGRALPFAAVAAGLELLHAAAVEVAGRALAVVGPSGSGKSSVAAALVARGGRLLTDDVLAFGERDGALVAHAGPPTLALRDAETERLGAAASALGMPAGAGGGKAYLATEPPAASLPLGRVVSLRRTAEPAALELAALPAPSASAVLGMLFAPELVTPQRIRSQLDLVAALVERTPFAEARFGAGVTADDIAEALLA